MTHPLPGDVIDGQTILAGIPFLDGRIAIVRGARQFIAEHCPFCGGGHLHGLGGHDPAGHFFGHRGAHCPHGGGLPPTPAGDTGYYLWVP